VEKGTLHVNVSAGTREETETNKTKREGWRDRLDTDIYTHVQWQSQCHLSDEGTEKGQAFTWLMNIPTLQPEAGRDNRFVEERELLN